MQTGFRASFPLVLESSKENKLNIISLYPSLPQSPPSPPPNNNNTNNNNNKNPDMKNQVQLTFEIIHKFIYCWVGDCYFINILKKDKKKDKYETSRKIGCHYACT